MDINKQPTATDPNKANLGETSSENNSIKTEISNFETSSENTPDSVSTDMTPSNYSEDFENNSNNTSTDSDVKKSNEAPSNEAPIIDQNQTTDGVMKEPIETPPIKANIPVKTDNIKTVSKTQKHYNSIVNKADNIRKKFTKTRKTMPTWDSNKMHEWRSIISDTLISVIRVSKNKHTLKQHHGKLKKIRNLLNHYLNI